MIESDRNDIRSSFAARSAFRLDVFTGLSASQRVIPAHWLYDLTGSRLFEEITELPEYYVTRVEHAILADHAADIIRLVGPGRALVEFGSGTSTKTELLLAHMAAASYVPIDISKEVLADSVSRLSLAFPGLPIYPVNRDFTHRIMLPMAKNARSLGFLPGSTIGNLTPPNAVRLLNTMIETLGPEAKLLIGIDRIKSADVLLPAYDDAQGVTAKFNLNVLHRINIELDGTIPVDAFEHEVWVFRSIVTARFGLS